MRRRTDRCSSPSSRRDRSREVARAQDTAIESSLRDGYRHHVGAINSRSSAGVIAPQHRVPVPTEIRGHATARDRPRRGPHQALAPSSDRAVGIRTGCSWAYASKARLRSLTPIPELRVVDRASPPTRRSSGRVWRRHGRRRQTRALASRRSPKRFQPRQGATRINPRRTRAAVPHSADEPDAPPTRIRQIREAPDAGGPDHLVRPARGHGQCARQPRRPHAAEGPLQRSSPGPRPRNRKRGIGIAGTTTQLWWKRSCQGTA